MTRAQGPIWDDIQIPRQAPLKSDIAVDVAIIGGGMTGVSAAYLLAGRDLSVALIEKDRIGFGATGVTTAFISAILDTNMKDLLSLYGAERGRVLIGSHREAIETIRRIVEKEHIDCDFLIRPSYLYASTESEHAALQEELAAGAQLGYEIAPVVGDLRIHHYGALEIQGQAQFHPLKYMRSLIACAKERGVQFFEETAALSLEGALPVRITTTGGTISAPFVLVATYEPFTKPLALYFKKAFYASYILSGTIEKGALREGTYENLANPYDYFRIDAGAERDRIIFGGADHRSDIPVREEKNYKAIENHARATFPGIDFTFDREWRGPILEPMDGIAYIGHYRNPDLFVAMGFSGNGMTYAHIAAKMFADHVLGNGSPYLALYEPARVPDFKELYVKGRDYIEEFFGGAVKNAMTYTTE